MPTFARTVATLAFTATAFSPVLAADLPARPMPTKAPVFSPEPVYSWTGFYVGGNVGWNWTESTAVDTGPGVFGQVFPIGDTTTIQRNGFMGGAQAGYNYQMGQFMIGVEADFDWSAANKKQSGALPGLTFDINFKNNYVSTFGARFGYAMDRVLLYAKAGGAYTQDDFDLSASDGSTFNGRFDRWGWMIGAGVEYAILNNWTLKAEYNYLDFGTKSETLTPNATDLVTGTITDDPRDNKLHAHVVKIGFNYLFH